MVILCIVSWWDKTLWFSYWFSIQLGGWTFINPNEILMWKYSGVPGIWPTDPSPYRPYGVSCTCFLKPIQWNPKCLLPDRQYVWGWVRIIYQKGKRMEKDQTFRFRWMSLVRSSLVRVRTKLSSCKWIIVPTARPCQRECFLSLSFFNILVSVQINQPG